MTLGVRCRGGVVLVFVSRSWRLVPLESVTFMSWEARIFLISLVREGWLGKEVFSEGAHSLSCLLNCFAVIRLGLHRVSV